MPILLGLIGLAASAYFVIVRVKRGAEMASGLMDAAQDVRGAARRFGFRRQGNQHPVEAVEDPNLAVAALATAFMQLDDLPTADARRALDVALRCHLNLDGDTAQEIEVLGHWLVEQCGGAAPAFSRLSKRLHKLDEGASFPTLIEILSEVTSAGSKGGPSTRQSEALTDLAHVFSPR
ncbi:hypothetical protein C1J03_08420 [Sulfitobacter sp. SK012]|uniref:hypothetical protein n=1 Tax=Sulfitobacter sp. SK012 TaxID=1389005 RepID=UPI000E0BAA3B|nr:hypothetical protein [Sulfitobacter sp. SK012]AXI46036.1 hypothetical protein C1J03_08420 [Sulfitobacter sp. SK012]